jgi:hypothetical protein
MSRTYQVVETVVIRRVCNVRAGSEQEAIAKATDGNARGLAVGVGLIDFERVDVYAARPTSPDTEKARWIAREMLCDAWLTQLHSLDGFSQTPNSSPGRGRFARNRVSRAADIHVLEG